MAKQPKPDDATKEINADTPTSQTGGTLSVTSAPTTEPEDKVALSDTIRAGLEGVKIPEVQIMVIGPKGGRWRAGRHFGPEPTIIDVADLTEDEGRALVNDPKLIVGPAFPPVPS